MLYANPGEFIFIIAAPSPAQLSLSLPELQVYLMLDLPLMKSPHNGFSWTDFRPGLAGGGIFLPVFPLVQFSVESGRIKV